MNNTRGQRHAGACASFAYAPNFSAIFAARPDQHAGLGTNFVDVPWVMFSTKWGRRLYGRTHLLNVDDKKLAEREDYDEMKKVKKKRR